MEWYITLLIGYILGIVTAAIKSRCKKPDGVFRVNLYDPMDEVFRLELHRPLEGIQNCKCLVFKVINEQSRE